MGAALLDILIVSHDTQALLSGCLASVRANTLLPHTINVWDNGSSDGTRERMQAEYPGAEVAFHWEAANTGFIEPNNELFGITSSPYVCLLNSDTVVKPGWDTALLGALQVFQDFGAAGMSGGMFDAAGAGRSVCFTGKPAGNIDYVEGWCLCLRRELVEEKLGGLLFDDENLSFAYYEDADLCLRLREAGHPPLALPNGDEKSGLWVDHLRGQTSAKLLKSSDRSGLLAALESNRAYFVDRWSGYLGTQRAELAKKPVT